MEIEVNLKYSLLLELYKNLLTLKQQKILKDFLDNNISISELAVEYHSSRQAVNDLLKRTFKILDDYEKKLMLLKKFEGIKNNSNLILDELKNQKLDKSKIEKNVNNILEVL